MPQHNPYHPNPFGSVMQGRNWTDVNRNYRYGFNGKEKDFETANDNYDFGARIYDGRLGRWLSLDPLIFKKSFLSAFSSSRNNPILYIDEDGKDEFIYWTIYDARTGKTTIKIERISDTYDKKPCRSEWTGDLTYEFYHIYHPMNVFIDKKGKRTVTSSSSVRGTKCVYKRHPLFQFWPHSSNKDEEGNGERVPGGEKCQAENGGTSPTKTVSDNPGETINVDLLIAAKFGNGKVSKIQSLSEMVKSIFEKADEVAKLNKVDTENTIEFCERKTCSNVDCTFNDPKNIKKAYEAYWDFNIPIEEKLKPGAKNATHDSLGTGKVDVRCR